MQRYVFWGQKVEGPRRGWVGMENRLDGEWGFEETNKEVGIIWMGLPRRGWAKMELTFQPELSLA